MRITVKDVGGTRENGHRECFGIRIFLNDAGQPQHQLSESFSLANNAEGEFTFPFTMKNDGDYSYYVRVYDIGAYQNCQYWNEGRELDRFDRTYMFTAGNRVPELTLTSPDTNHEVELGDAEAFTAQCDDQDDAQSTLTMDLFFEESKIDSRQRLVNTGTQASETFQFNDPGEYLLVATCKDDEGAASESASWAIATENQAPVASRVAPAADTTHDVGDSVIISLQCDDLDEDPLTAAIIVDHPGGATTQEADDVEASVPFEVELPLGEAGRYDVQGVCSDGVLENTVAWVITAEAIEEDTTSTPPPPPTPPPVDESEDADAAADVQEPEDVQDDELVDENGKDSSSLPALALLGCLAIMALRRR